MPADSGRMVKAFLLLLVLLVAAAGTGYWNYNRNAGLVADAYQERPYKTLSTADVTQLLAAYEKEAGRAKQGVMGAPGEASQIDAYDSSDVGGKAEAFAQYQRQNDHWKNERGKAMEQEFMVKGLRFEKSIRDRHLDDEKARFWLRLTTF